MTLQKIDPPVADWVTIPDLYRDPYPIYERLRAEGGVHWVPAVRRYLITSYHAVHETELDQETFSANEEGSLQIRAMGHSMIRRDDPEHYLERTTWQPVLRPGVVKRIWTDMFIRNANHYLDAFIEKGPGADLVWDFAAPYAAESLREIIGFHNVTQEDLQRWSQTMIDATGNYADDPEVWAKGKQSYDEVDAALDEMLAWHSTHPDHSLISSLLATPEDVMPVEKIRSNLKMTIGGGLNEPRDALGVTAWALMTHPEQRAAVDADPSLWPTVFEESIRWVSPIGMYSRQTTREVDVAGVRLPAGAKLGICILSANRDTEVWPDADRFDIHRAVTPHLAFGKGVHVCLGAWVAKAEVATVGLPLLFQRLRGLDLIPEQPAQIGGWVFRGMTKLPVSWERALPDAIFDLGADATARAGVPAVAEETAPSPRVAIVGSGPAGCFTAQALRRTFPNAPIDIYEQLPVPFGLVRYGVAADHQGTKTVARQFERLFTHEGVRFIGNTRVDEQKLRELREAYDVVVVATGLRADAELNLPGAPVHGVVGAGAVTRFLNSHPLQQDLAEFGAQVAVIGQGNVAMDVVRLLARDTEGLTGSDIDDQRREQLAGAIRTLHVVGRSLPGEAKFDPVMVREIAGLGGVRHVVHGVDVSEVPEGKDARWDAVRDLALAGAATWSASAPLQVEWWFGATPEAYECDENDALRGISVRLSDRAEPVTIAADTVVTAIGFAPDPDTLVAPGSSPDGRVEPGLYVAGWLRRGPRGTIPDQRTDAKDLARIIGEDLTRGRISATRPGAEPHVDAVDFDGWRRIDLAEQLRAPIGRSRAKLATLAEMLDIARDTSIALPEITARDDAASDEGMPITIWFGTESGGAELVADDLKQLLAARAQAEVRDLADATPGTISAERFHVFVCSTYGDGELPANARDFTASLAAPGTDLSAVRYAMFGMGDRSYAKTYSRGSELLDEALAAAGAQRVGEYGRHDAGGSVDAAQAAGEWIEGVLVEAETRV